MGLNFIFGTTFLSQLTTYWDKTSNFIMLTLRNSPIVFYGFSRSLEGYSCIGTFLHRQEFSMGTYGLTRF